MVIFKRKLLNTTNSYISYKVKGTSDRHRFRPKTYHSAEWILGTDQMGN